VLTETNFCRAKPFIAGGQPYVGGLQNCLNAAMTLVVVITTLGRR